MPEDVLNPPPAPPSAHTLRSLAEIERDHALYVLEAGGGGQNDAARIPGIDGRWR